MWSVLCESLLGLLHEIPTEKGEETKRKILQKCFGLSDAFPCLQVL